MNIGFIGIGKLGKPCAEVMVDKGHYVKGYDINVKSSNKIKVVDSIKECVENTDIVFIAVPTPHESDYDGSTPTSHLVPKDFDYSLVEDCIVESNKYMTGNQILVLISTVLPGTVRNKLAPLVTNTKLIYNPYLIAMGSVAWDMINPEMVMIGTQTGKDNYANILINFYQSLMENNPRYIVGTWDECECIKVFYNTFISAKISLVNMIQDVAVKQGNINVDVVTDALAKSTMRIMGPQYMKAGMGDGGACHPRDNIALRFLASKLNLGYDLFDAIMAAREIQAKNLASFLVDILVQNNLKNVYIHGKAYKPRVSYCDGSYSLLVGHYIETLGYTPIYIDKYTNDYYETASDGVMLLAHNNKVTYGYSGNKDEQELYCTLADNLVIVDPWRTFKTSNPNVKVIYYGDTNYNKSLV